MGLPLWFGAMVVLMVAPAVASAEALCTDTWTGPSKGNWVTAEDWSSGVPTSTAVACIGVGDTVEVTEGTNATGVLQDKGALTVRGGSLEVTSAIEASRTSAMELQHGGTLTGVGTLEVSSSLTWHGGTMSGSGETVIDPGASGAAREALLTGRRLVNQGTLAIEAPSVQMADHAVFQNEATTLDNSEGGASIEVASGSITAPSIVNSGIFEKTERDIEDGSTTAVAVPFDNLGTVKSLTGFLNFTDGGSSNGAAEWASSGPEAIVNFAAGSYSMVGSTLAGTIHLQGATVTAESVQSSTAGVHVVAGSLVVQGATMKVSAFELQHGASVSGAGTLEVSSGFEWNGGTMSGLGETVVERGASGLVREAFLSGRTVTNEGTLEFQGQSLMANGATFRNEGTSVDNVEYAPSIAVASESTSRPLIVNTGTFKKTYAEPESGKTTVVAVAFENFGSVEADAGYLHLSDPIVAEPEELWGEENPSAPEQELASCGESVSCNGNFTQTQTDFAIGGRGVGLDLSRTYNSQAAALGEHGIFGYGWSSSLSDHLVLEPTRRLATLIQADGSSVPFAEGSGEAFTAPAWTQDILHGSSTSGYTLTLENQTVYKFAGSTGRLESVTERDGNATTLAYNGSGNLETITDPDSRQVKLKYNSEGLVESAEDPMKRVVKYTYESGNLKTVTQPDETALRWQFKYEAHQLTEMTDGRGGVTVNKYNSSHELTEQTDPMKRVTTFEYLPFQTRTTNQTTGATTVQYITSTGLSAAVTHGYGTPSATTESSKYNAAGEPVSVTNGDGHTTTYEYENGNRTRMVEPEGQETKWTYDSKHDILTTTTPDGETTTIKRDTAGEPEVIERPVGSEIERTEYKYNEEGELTEEISPLKDATKYTYDAAGDKETEKDPEGDERTWKYNKDSQEEKMVSPRGHVSGAKEADFTTTTLYNTRGLRETVETPLKHKTTYTYDGDDNIETETDPEGDKTTYTYDADNERTKIKQPDGTTTETGYDGAGQITSETDGNKHTTEYKRNVLEQVHEIVDPLSRKTVKEYDAAGNLESVRDAEERTTTYMYNHDSRLIGITYSGEKASDVEYEYNGDGDRTKMVDGTGTTTYEYDLLDRLEKANEEGHGIIVRYKYNLANEPTAITYPNEKVVTREYDKDGRLEKVTDWNSKATTFKYNADSDLAKTVFPTATDDEDTYAYNEDDQMSEIKMTKGSETFASLVYARNKDEEVTKATTSGLPGEEKPAFSYDEDSRLTKGAGTKYAYDEANSPTTIGSDTYSYDVADELEHATDKKTTEATYTYDKVGERTKTELASGLTTTYGYSQAGDLTSVTQRKGTETPTIEDSYGYNGDDLRTSQTISGKASYLAWDTTDELPLLLNDGTDSYIYGPGGFPFEQIANAGTTLYLHHDQQGSTRVVTSATGTVSGRASYDAYGNVLPESSVANLTPMGYDGQYTNADTGLIYLRAREYDPATGVFLSVDPKVMETREPYVYAEDDPVAVADLSGECPATAASIRGPHSVATPAECKKKLNALHRITSQVKRRLKGLLKDEHELSEAEIHSHEDSLNEISRALEKELSAFKSRGCEETLRVKIPAEVITLSELRWQVTVKPVA